MTKEVGRCGGAGQGGAGQGGYGAGGRGLALLVALARTQPPRLRGRRSLAATLTASKSRRVSEQDSREVSPSNECNKCLHWEAHHGPSPARLSPALPSPPSPPFPLHPLPSPKDDGSVASGNASDDDAPGAGAPHLPGGAEEVGGDLPEVTSHPSMVLYLTHKYNSRSVARCGVV
jgi:hypothetical protein